MASGQGGFDFAPQHVDQDANAVRGGQGVYCCDEISKRACKYADAVAHFEIDCWRQNSTRIAARLQACNQSCWQWLGSAGIVQDKARNATRAVDGAPTGVCGVKINKDITRKERLAGLPLDAGFCDDSEQFRAEYLKPLTMQVGARV